MERATINWADLVFGYQKTDCHLEYYFRNGSWEKAKVVEDDTLHLNIAATCLHYGQEAFEGLKVFEQKDGTISVFRVEENARRMINSAKKILMQPFPEEMFIEAVDELVKLNKRFIPPYGSGASLYIRPLLLGISGLIGVKQSSDYLFTVFCIPVGPYFKSGIKPISLYVEESMDRAAPDGVGDVKVGGNYAASLRVSKKARDLGYNEVLYLDAREKKYIDESGPANFFGIKENTYITPKSPSILPSITNMSLMTLAEQIGMKVERRPIEVPELGTLEEAGACGTAAVISPIKKIFDDDNNISYDYCKDGNPGPVTVKLYDKLKAIQCGDEEDINGWIEFVD